MYQASAPMNICILAGAIVYRFINSDCNAPYVMGEFARVKERRGLPDSLRVGAASDLDIEHQIGLGQGLTGQYISGLELQIGRASCRERACQYVSISVGAVALQKKNRQKKK